MTAKINALKEFFRKKSYLICKIIIIVAPHTNFSHGLWYGYLTTKFCFTIVCILGIETNCDLD